MQKTNLTRRKPQDLKIAIAGRNKAKLEAVRDALIAKLPESPLKSKTQNLPILIADSSDQESLDVVARSSKVVLSTVGPFLQYGKPLVDSCVRYGTDYVDSTGETTFIKDLIDSYEDAAIENKARIVPSCGFDSLPSDIGALLVANYFADLGKETASVRAVAIEVSGGVSGGTIHTAAGVIEGSSLSKLAKFSEPYLLLSKDDSSTRPDPGTLPVLQYNKDLQLYETVWVMATGNSAYVRRSWGLLNRGYGKKFKYSESLGASNIFAGLGVLIGVTGLFLALMFPPTRWLIKKLVPQGTNTTSEVELRKGKVLLKFVGLAEDGTKIIASYKMNVDPGYVGTGLMLAESAIGLVLDDKVLKAGRPENVGKFGVKDGGILTAASALGLVIVKRLKNAGVEIDIQ
ncbi:hypothetical protein HK100_004068, partial [Physocladia obscura]